MRCCRKLLAIAFALVIFISLAPAALAAKGADKAETVIFKVSDRNGKNKGYWKIYDGKPYSKYEAAKAIDLTFKPQKNIKGMYFVFDKPCQWTVTLPDGAVMNGGENGFIHEYMEFDTEVNRFELHLPAGAVLCEAYAYTAGELPSNVQRWEPPCETADLLVMPTHADDEHLWFGGALPYYAGELGYQVQVVYMTNHSEESIREHERLNGLWAVGVKHYPIVPAQFTDHKKTKKYDDAVERFGYDNVLAYQVEMLRRFKPKVIIAHDIDGEYGHGAHILNARTLLDALPLTDDPSAFPESAAQYGTCRVQKCYLHLWKENTIVMNWNRMRLKHFGGKTAMEMARIGYSFHVSQQNNFSMHESGSWDCRKFGLAYTNVGLDTPGVSDMFEHVDWTVRETAAFVSVSDSDSGSGKTVSETDAGADGEEGEARTPFFRNAKTWIIVSLGAVAALVVAVLLLRFRAVRKRIVT